jgi:hypothetical protein
VAATCRARGCGRRRLAGDRVEVGDWGGAARKGIGGEEQHGRGGNWGRGAATKTPNYPVERRYFPRAESTSDQPKKHPVTDERTWPNVGPTHSRRRVDQRCFIAFF